MAALPPAPAATPFRTSALLLFEGLVHAEPGCRKPDRTGLFLFLYAVHEIASPAVVQFLSIGSLDFAAAERTRDGPAGAARILSAMRAVQLRVGRDRADAELGCLAAARLPSAFFMLPAVQLTHILIKPPIQSE